MEEVALNETKKDKKEEVRLEAKLNLINGITVIVGSIIGSGIFITPSGVLQYTGSVNLSIIVWMICGVFSMVGAYCYAELGCMITRTGADYAYIFVTFGPFLAFMRLWVECIIVRPCSQAIVALTFSVYILRPFYETCPSPDIVQRLLAAVCITILTFINCWKVKWATRVQDIFTYAKLLALLIIIVTGLVQLGKGEVKHFTFDGTEKDFTKIALSFYSGLFAYNGWNYLNFIIEELKDPVRNLPRAITISCILVTVVYVMTNVAFFTTLSPSELLQSEAVAVTFADRLFGVMSLSIPIFVALSTFGAVNGILMTSSRLFYAGAREGQLPVFLTMIQVNRITPAPAVLVVLINYVSFVTWLSIGIGVLCLPWLRWKHPEWKRPIKVNLIFPFLYLLATLFITVVPMISSPAETGIGALIILTGVPVYAVFIWWQNKPRIFHTFLRIFTETLQKLMIIVPSHSQEEDL